MANPLGETLTEPCNMKPTPGSRDLLQFTTLQLRCKKKNATTYLCSGLLSSSSLTNELFQNETCHTTQTADGVWKGLVTFLNSCSHYQQSECRRAPNVPPSLASTPILTLGESVSLKHDQFTLSAVTEPIQSAVCTVMLHRRAVRYTGFNISYSMHFSHTVISVHSHNDFSRQRNIIFTAHRRGRSGSELLVLRVLKSRLRVYQVMVISLNT